MKRALALGIGILIFGMAACNSGPSEEEISASVEAQVAMAMTETVEAVPTDTATPMPSDTPVPTDTPIPTDTPTPEPTNTPRSTNTPRPTNTPTPVPEPVVLTGSGDSVVELEGWPTGKPAVLHIVGPPLRGHFAIWNYDAQGERIDLLVNTGDPYEGYIPMNFMVGEETKRFEVKSSGAWTIEVLPLVPDYYNHTLTVPGVYEGLSDDLVILSGDIPDLASFEATNGHFAVWSFGVGERDLLVNESAPYQGTVIMPSDTNLLVVTASGAWKMDITSR